MNNETRRYAPVLDWDIVDGRKKFKALMVEAAFAPKMYVTEADHAAEIERLSKERDEARISLIVKRANEPCTCEDYMSFSCPRHGKASYEFMQIMTSGADEVEVSAIHPSILDALKDEHAKREAAESKLSQLQLSNETLTQKLQQQKAEIIRVRRELGEIQTRNEKSDGLGILGMTIGMRARLYDVENEIVAILNGGQQ